MKNVFWTGGWDSTFHVLDLLLLKNETVQPYYIIDPQRKSLSMEIRAMKRIRDAVFEQYPGKKGNLQETIMVDLNQIRFETDMKKCYDSFVSHSNLGIQYLWLCQFARQSNVNGLELCVESGNLDCEFTRHVFGIHTDDLVLINEGDDFYYQIRDRLVRPELALFQRVRFPVFHLSKMQMDQYARENGFSTFMEMTWFCHNPRKDGRPCGACRPCRITREDGLGRRVPKPTLYESARSTASRALSMFHKKSKIYHIFIRERKQRY